MSVHADLTKLDQEAARIALLVLRANVRCVTPPHGYVIPPEQRPVPPMQAESALARLVKPVHCNARMEGNCLPWTANCSRDRHVITSAREQPATPTVGNQVSGAFAKSPSI